MLGAPICATVGVGKCSMNQAQTVLAYGKA